MSEESAAAALAAAWDCGIRYFDTSPHYGIGVSERLIGAALRDWPRAEYTLSTKVGRILEPLDKPDGMDPVGFKVLATHRRVWDFSRDGIVRSVEDSLARMGVDRFDVQVVPYTMTHTNLARAELRDRVNLEVDVVGKYVVRAAELAGLTLTAVRPGEVTH